MKISVKTSGSGTPLLLRATWDDLKSLNTQTTLLINYGRNLGVEPGTRAPRCFHPFGRMLGCPAGYRGAEGGVIIRHQKMHVKEPQWQMWGRREGISREFRKDHSRMALSLWAALPTLITALIKLAAFSFTMQGLDAAKFKNQCF